MVVGPSPAALTTNLPLVDCAGVICPTAILYFMLFVGEIQDLAKRRDLLSRDFFKSLQPSSCL